MKKNSAGKNPTPFHILKLQVDAIAADIERFDDLQYLDNIYDMPEDLSVAGQALHQWLCSRRQELEQEMWLDYIKTNKRK